MQNYTFFPNPPHKNPKATRRPPQSSSLFCARAATRSHARDTAQLFSWHPTPNGHSSHNKSARTRTLATKDGENGKLGKKEKTWENLRNMEKVVYLCSTNPKIGYPGKFPARGKPSPTLPNV
jgi:hypothetical protein